MEHAKLFVNRKEFREWLEMYGQSSDGIWLVFDKSKAQRTLKAQEALEEALCFGWIDGQMKRIDECTYQKYFSLRREQSKWSEKNKALAMELEQKGLMSIHGLNKIQEAKKNGQWQKDQTIVIQEMDMEALKNALEGIEPAYSNFLAMSPSIQKTYTKAFLDPKTEKGKQKRMMWIIDRLHNNLKPM